MIDRPSVRLAAVTMVRNECDIIELFVKINARTFDEIFVFDHLSDDGTTEILSRLMQQGLPVRYARLEDPQFRQASYLSGAIRQIAEMASFTHVMPIDADEFLVSTDPSVTPKDVLSENLDVDGWGTVPWMTFFPISDDYENAAAPLFQNFRALQKEPRVFHKIIVGGEFGKRCRVFEGNHKVENDLVVREPVRLPLALQHVPVRSAAQIIAKSIQGAAVLAQKSTRLPGEGDHWDVVSQYVRERRFRLSTADLKSISYVYGCNSSPSQSDDLHFQADMRVGLPTDVIEHRDLARKDTVASIDRYIDRLVTQRREALNPAT